MSKEYVGFQLCDKVNNKNLESIVKNYETININNKNPNIDQRKILNYPIAKGLYTIQIYIYRGFLHRIEIDALNDLSEPKLANIIDEKYKTKYELSSSAGYVKSYDTSSTDKSIDINRSVGFGFKDDITYSCPKIEKKMRSEIESERNSESLKNSGGSKL